MLPTIDSRANNKNSTNKTRLNASQSRYTCNKYNHECFLPDYKLLSIPRTNNYHAMTGGCPCLPRAAAHPGSWRLTAAAAATTQHNNNKDNNAKKTTNQCHCHSNHKNGKEDALHVQQQQQNKNVCDHANSDANKVNTPTSKNKKENIGVTTVNSDSSNKSKTNVNGSAYKSTHFAKASHETSTACSSCTRLYKSNSHYASDYGRIRGPHRVHLRNTAIHGKCDTFGNLAFTSSSSRTLPSKYNQSNANAEKERFKQQQQEMLTLQGDLEALILDEHANRTKVESDIAELNEMNALGKVDALKDKQLKAARLRELAAVTEEELNHLLNNIHTIVHEPLNQTNMERVHRTLQREHEMQRCRDLIAAKKTERGSNA